MTTTHKFQLIVTILSFCAAFWLMNGIAIAQGKTDEPFAKADCVTPAEAVRAFCDAKADRLLASTLRIEIDQARIFLDDTGYMTLLGGGHGTVKEGRYFVTHWHYDIHPHSSFAQGTFPEIAAFTLYRADGSALVTLKDAPLTIADVYGETLVLDFGTRNGQGFFDALGVPSADFAEDGAAVIRPNQTVARINWNEQTTFVEWTTVRSIESEDDTLTVELETPIVVGSSGGGIFLDGQHIGNNWKIVWQTEMASDDSFAPFSVAALNASGSR